MECVTSLVVDAVAKIHENTVNMSCVFVTVTQVNGLVMPRWRWLHLGGDDLFSCVGFYVKYKSSGANNVSASLLHLVHRDFPAVLASCLLIVTEQCRFLRH